MYMFSCTNSCLIYDRPKDLKFARNLLIPKKGTVYDHVYIKRQYGSWNLWSSLITPFSIDEKAKVILKTHVTFSYNVQNSLENLYLMFCRALVVAIQCLLGHMNFIYSFWLSNVPKLISLTFKLILFLFILEKRTRYILLTTTVCIMKLFFSVSFPSYAQNFISSVTFILHLLKSLGMPKHRNLYCTHY